MARGLEVSTGFSLDTVTTNLIELGHPALIATSSVKDFDFVADFLPLGCAFTGKSSSCSLVSIPTATVVGKRTGHTACSSITVTSIREGVHLVKFEPRLTDDYILSVCYYGKHISGSPFTIKVIESGSLNGHWNLSGSELPAVSIGEPVNVILPEDAQNTGRKLSVSVHSSFGVCESSVNQWPHFKSIAVKFTPEVESSYFIKMMFTDSTGEKTSKTFVIQADSPNAQAIHCFIHDKDKHVFETPHQFCNSPIKFQVSTKKTKDGDSEKLDIFCQGPGSALVKLVNQDSQSGLEVCEVTPSKPGRYRLDVLWGGKPIRGNPFYLNIKPPQKRIGSSGLNLEKENFRIGVPYRFRLNCSDIGQGELTVSSNPSPAADINVKRILGERKELYYQCQVIPRQIGQHELWIKFDGHHLEESPCKVHFKPCGDATKCAMVSSSSHHQNVVIQISTAGAGEGKLVAKVEELNKHMYSRELYPVEMKQLSPELYEIKFNPGAMTECLLSVRYDNQHIPGSPFKISFCEVDRCGATASGEGLVSAQVGVWNHFHVSTENAGPGALWVRIESGTRERLDPIITRLSSSLLEVRYRPMELGNYSISLQWGQTAVHGSPFQMKCYSTMVGILKPPPAEVPLGIPVRFKVHSTGHGLSLNDLSVVATNHLGERFKGKAQLTNRNNNFDCTLVPPSKGKYRINVRWRENHIRGSPFDINVIVPPLPENVHVYGLRRSVAVGKESSFWIDTGGAGLGLLSIAVHGNQHPFKICSFSDPVNPHIVANCFCPTHMGDYIIDVRWSRQHIPGSPFALTVLDGEEEDAVMGVSSKEADNCDVKDNLQEGVTFF